MKNEIKKCLYRQKPKATLLFIRKGVAYYESKIEYNDNKEYIINFEVPVNDMGDADFFPIMDAKLMNRWLVLNE